MATSKKSQKSKSPSVPKAVRTAEIRMDKPDTVLIMGEDVEPSTEEDWYLVDPDESRFAINEEMLDDIMHDGIRQPGKTIMHNGKLFVLDGRRRLRHGRKANEVIHEASPTAAAILFPSVLDPGPVTIEHAANSYAFNMFAVGHGHMAVANRAGYLLKHGYPKASIARKLDLNRGTMENRLALLKLIPSAQSAVASGKLASGAAIALAELPADEQAVKLDLALGGSGKHGQLAAITGTPETAANTSTANTSTSGGSPDPKSDVRIGPWKVALIAKAIGTEAAKKLPPNLVSTMRVLAGEAPASSVPGLEAVLIEARTPVKPTPKAAPTAAAEAAS